jgi:glutamate-1-semialdehyde 2,1-aminomutase
MYANGRDAPARRVHARSRAIAAETASLIPGGVNSSLRFTEPPLVFTRANGSRVIDADGNEYVDFHNAFGPIILGHAHAGVLRRVTEVARDLDIVGVGSTLLELELARTIARLIPSAERVLFANTGSEATYHAVRVSRAVTGRPLLVKFQGCYHGWHDAVAANVISPPDRLGRIDPISAGVMPQALERLVVLPFNDVEALEALMTARGEQVAAVILEPIIHTIGCVLPTPDFLAALRRTTAEHGSVLIFDEVVTGFRHDLGGYQGIAGIRPDLSTFAKAIANGYPLGVLCGRADLMERFNTGPTGDVLFGGTFNANAVSVAAALATIEALEADDRAIHRHLFALGERMRVGLQSIVDRLGMTARATSFGSVFVLYFTDREVRSYDDALTNDADRYVGFHRGMTERGFLMLPMNLKRNHLTAAHTAEDVDRALQAAEDVLGDLASRSREGTAVASPAGARVG